MSKWKKALQICGYLLLTGILGAYFYFATILVHQKSQDRCQQVLIIVRAVSYTHLRAHETPEHLVCRLPLEKKNVPLLHYLYYQRL